MITEVSTPVAQGARKVVNVQPLLVSRVYTSPFQKEGTLTAELKQTVETKSFYPSKSVSNDLKGNPFSPQDFGFAEQEFTSTEVRVAWIDVPMGTTAEVVEAKLAALPTAKLYKILANKPILSDSQKYGISAGLTTIDAIGDSQVIRYPEASEKGGQLILKDGKPQYRSIYFTTSQVDQDMRTAIASDFYATATIKAELENVVSVGQESL